MGAGGHGGYGGCVTTGVTFSKTLNRQAAT